jgi:hypothetical protein
MRQIEDTAFDLGADEVPFALVQSGRNSALPHQEPTDKVYHILSSIKGIEKEIGVIKKEKSKLRHILRIEHGNIPIQLDLWGN